MQAAGVLKRPWHFLAPNSRDSDVKAEFLDDKSRILTTSLKSTTTRITLQPGILTKVKEHLR